MTTRTLLLLPPVRVDTAYKRAERSAVRGSRGPYRSFVLVLLGAGLIGCAGGGRPENKSTPSSSATSAGPHAKRPFTAEQIRAATTVGAARRYRTEKEGEPAMFTRTRVAAASGTHATFETHVLGSDGQPVGEPERSTSTWIELMEHATFPVDRTTIEDISLRTPAGTFDAWLYTVEGPKPGIVTRFYFAKEHPGAPVQYEQIVDRKVVFKVVMISAS